MALSPDLLVNNLWVIISGLLVFSMTISVGLLEVGELGEGFDVSLLKTMLMTGIAIFVMALVGFNTAFAPTINGVIGDPGYNGLFLGGFNANATGVLNGVWWSMQPGSYFGTGLTVGTYFLFETAFAAVTLALVGVVVLRKIRLGPFILYSFVYFILVWNLPAAWIWNPTGWLFQRGMADFAGGLVVHAAAGAAGLGLVVQIWREERRSGLTNSVQIPIAAKPTWLTLSILLLWMGWFGFNGGSVLAFNNSAMTVVLTTFLAAASSFLSLMLFRYQATRRMPDLVYATNGVLMGLIIITPLAGFVSPASSVILGLTGGPLFLAGEKFFGRFRWFSDPVGLFPGHLLGGTFGVLMIAFFSQKAFATAAGTPSLPDGLLFGGGAAAVQQLGVELLGLVSVIVTVFALSFLTIWAISKATGGVSSNTQRVKSESLAATVPVPK